MSIFHISSGASLSISIFHKYCPRRYHPVSKTILKIHKGCKIIILQVILEPSNSSALDKAKFSLKHAFPSNMPLNYFEDIFNFLMNLPEGRDVINHEFWTLCNVFVDLLPSQEPMKLQL